MIYNVLVYDEYGHPIDVYRIGAWDEDNAEDYISTKLVKQYGVTAIDKTFQLVPEDRLFLVVPVEEVLEVRHHFFSCLGLDAASPA